MDGRHPRRFTARGPRALTGRLSSGDALRTEGEVAASPWPRQAIVVSKHLPRGGHLPLQGPPLLSRSVTSASCLVDPASIHMLVSKIKPCMCKYKPVLGETANGSLNQLWFLRSLPRAVG